MNDYTPTTEQVRDGYRFNPEDDYYNPTQAGANAERNGRAFDRWLEQVKAEAWDAALDDAYRVASATAARTQSIDAILAALTPRRQERDQ